MTKIPKITPRIVRPIVEVKKPRWTRICKKHLPQAGTSIVSQPAPPGKAELRAAGLPAAHRQILKLGVQTLEQRLRFAVWGKVQVRVVDQHIHRNSVVQ